VVSHQSMKCPAGVVSFESCRHHPGIGFRSDWLSPDPQPFPQEAADDVAALTTGRPAHGHEPLIRRHLDEALPTLLSRGPHAPDTGEAGEAFGQPDSGRPRGCMGVFSQPPGDSCRPKRRHLLDGIGSRAFMNRHS
jgi:hypothetical protein